MTIEKAAAHFDRARYDLAEQEARAALAADPDNPLGLSVLSMALTRLGRGEDALYEAEAAVSVAPHLAVGYVAHAQALSSLNQFTRALRSAAEAIRLEPQDPDNHALLAHVEAASNRWAEVYEATSHGLEVAADHAELKRLRSVAAVHLGKLEEADEETIAALRIPGAAPGTMAGRGHDLLLAGRIHDAQRAFLGAIQSEPDSELARAGLVGTVKADKRVLRPRAGLLRMGVAADAAAADRVVGRSGHPAAGGPFPDRPRNSVRAAVPGRDRLVGGRRDHLAGRSTLEPGAAGSPRRPRVAARGPATGGHARRRAAGGLRRRCAALPRGHGRRLAAGRRRPGDRRRRLRCLPSVGRLAADVADHHRRCGRRAGLQRGRTGAARHRRTGNDVRAGDLLRERLHGHRRDGHFDDFAPVQRAGQL